MQRFSGQRTRCRVDAINRVAAVVSVVQMSGGCCVSLADAEPGPISAPRLPSFDPSFHAAGGGPPRCQRFGVTQRLRRRILTLQH